MSYTLNLQCKNREYFTQFVTEDIDSYVSRKRKNYVHGNHIEIQAISEIYNRPVELYSYHSGKWKNVYINLKIENHKQMSNILFIIFRTSKYIWFRTNKKWC